MKLKLTDSVVRKLEPPQKGLRIVTDQVLRGFGVRVLPSGSKAFVLDYSARSSKRSLWTIARFMGIGYEGSETEAARRKALLLQARIKEEGFDPALEKRTARHTAKAALTVKKLIDAFTAKCEHRIKEGELRVQTLKVYRAHLAALGAKFGPRVITTITRKELEAWRDEVAEARGKVAANCGIAVASAVFGFALEREHLTVNPAAHIKAKKTSARTRVLDAEERKAVWAAAEGLGYPFGPITRLLLLLGQRRAEVGEMRWAELDLDKGLWTLPAERAKNGVTHKIPLPPVALQILRDVPKPSEEFVFASATGTTPASGWSDAKRKLDKAAPLTSPWTWHDLRRTCATGLAELGIAPQVTEAILNHIGESKAGVAGIYQRHDFHQEATRALERWERALTGFGEAQVIDLAERRAGV
jgi:integrase